MEVLEVQLRILGHPVLHQATRDALMAVEVSGPCLTLSIDLLTPLGKSDDPLYRLLESELRRARAMALIKWGLMIIVSALAGALLQWLFGGDLLP